MTATPANENKYHLDFTANILPSPGIFDCRHAVKGQQEPSLNDMEFSMQSGCFPLRPLAVALGLLTLPLLVQANDTAHETLVITATQTQHTELSAPASVSVVTRRDLEKMNATTLSEALKGVTGVNIAPASAYGRSEIRLRGLEGDYTLLLIDGRRVNSREALSSAYANDFDLSSIPMAAIERIEVLRGPISSLYGADALGGVVNVILRKAGEHTEGAASYTSTHPTEGDGGDGNRGSGYLSGALIDRVLLGNLVVEGNHKQAWQSDLSRNAGSDASEKREKWSALSNLTWLIDPRQELALGGSYAKDDRLAHWNNYGTTVQNDQQMERLGLHLTHSGRWEHVDSRLGYAFEQADLHDDSQLMTALTQRPGEVTQTNHTVDGQLSTQLGDHQVTAGSEYRINELKHNVNLTKKASVDQYALYLQDEIGLGDLTLTLSGRLDDHQTYGSEFSPRAYALYALTDAWVLKGGIGRAFKAPTIAQTDADYAVPACRGRCSIIGNPDLEPETAVSYEAGTAYNSPHYGGALTLFHNDIRNKIQSDAWSANHRPSVMTYYNVDDSRIQGVELSGWLTLQPGLTLSANATVLDAEDKSTGLDLYKTPEHTFNAALAWQALPSLDTRLSWNYVGSQTIPVPRMSGATYERSEGYHTFDLGLVWQAMPQLDIRAGMTNLTNAQRDGVATDADLILEGRTLYAGLDYRL